MSQKKSVVAIFLIFFLQWLAIGLCYPLFSFFLFDKDLSFVPLQTTDAQRGLWLGVVFGALSLTQFFISPIVGTLSDQKGRKTILLIVFAINFLGTLLSFFSVMQENLFLLILSRVFLGLGAASTGVVYAVITDTNREEKRPKSFGLLTATKGVGYAGGSYLSGVIASGDITTPFLFATLITLLVPLIITFFYKETYTQQKKEPWLQQLKEGFQIPHLKLALLAIFLFCFGWSFYFEFFPVMWIRSFHIQPAQVGTLYALAIGFNAFCSAVLIRPVFNRFSYKTVLLWSTPLLGLSMAAQMWMSTTFIGWIIPLQQFLISLIYVALITALSHLAGRKNQGQLMGTYQSIKSMSFAISPFAGAMLGITHTLPAALPTFFILLASVLVWIFLSTPAEQK